MCICVINQFEPTSKVAFMFIVLNTGPEERRYLAACEQAIKEKGSVTQTVMHCVFLGLPQSGKSSLIQRLLGKRLSKSAASTGVAENVVRVEIRKSTAHVSGLLWCELEDLDAEAVLVMHHATRTAPAHKAESAFLTAGVPVKVQAEEVTQDHRTEQHEQKKIIFWWSNGVTTTR